MRGRIRNLESLVVNLINQKAQEQGGTPSEAAIGGGTKDSEVADTEPAMESSGQLHIGHDRLETNYTAPGHWSSLLKEIEEPITRAQLIQEMPPKDEVDPLLPLWFNSADPLLYCIHAPTFQEEYKQFWKDPSTASTIWIGLLYSALALSIILGPRNPGMNITSFYHPEAEDLFGNTDSLTNAVDKLQQLTSSAIVLADVGRSQTEITPVACKIAKFRVCRVFGEAAQLSHRITLPKHSDIMELDKRLEESHDLIPEGMRVQPIEDCITDPPVRGLSSTTAGQTDSPFAESRKICIDAALMILNYHKIIVHACSPGGQLNKVWWYSSSLTTYDFLLAAMILCLELKHLQDKDPSSATISELYGILDNTLGIWTNSPSRFKASARGAEMLKTVLKRVSASDEANENVLRVATSIADGAHMEATAPPTELTPPEQRWAALPQADAASLELLDSNTASLREYQDPSAMYNTSGYTLPKEEHNICPAQ
ncbi:hypothetical protein BDV96DRAFT_655876 [Lophiotrema nucula]|uniref:Transcription factor domain-containing protein n=1 Tax=Lophiotrema nucula TaxID=690887 RepID=A0A6A5YFV0_9PLEO|nr:hypothetical protein BDV96DRAFT_655876 [Lophiotrema nucula]